MDYYRQMQAKFFYKIVYKSDICAEVPVKTNRCRLPFPGKPRRALVGAPVGAAGSFIRGIVLLYRGRCHALAILRLHILSVIYNRMKNVEAWSVACYIEFALSNIDEVKS